jgi:hypothetical protein
MWPASEISASELDMKPVTTSTIAKPSVSASDHASTDWLRCTV